MRLFFLKRTLISKKTRLIAGYLNSRRLHVGYMSWDHQLLFTTKHVVSLPVTKLFFCWIFFFQATNARLQFSDTFLMVFQTSQPIRDQKTHPYNFVPSSSSFSKRTLSCSARNHVDLNASRLTWFLVGHAMEA